MTRGKNIKVKSKLEKTICRISRYRMDRQVTARSHSAVKICKIQFVIMIVQTVGMVQNDYRVRGALVDIFLRKLPESP